ncbi:MAG: hypothetical protein ACPGJV_11815 [Bacteriovoracaceae bacterium]
MSEETQLIFESINTEEGFKEIFDYSIDVFSDSPDFQWTLDGIKQEVAEGWSLEAVKVGVEIIAAIFFKMDNKVLATKNTALKATHQGSGYSHLIKEYLEQKAKSLKAKTILHYCGIDNFRMYSLNESHGYTKTQRRFGKSGHIVEWEKTLK